MKHFKILFLFIFVILPITIFSQEISDNLKINSYKLKNGLSVYLNEDKSVPNVLGAVIIKTGGKYDPANHTGTSHYLEHMMFKGTDELGTTNYKKESIYLDSIVLKYDELAKTEDPEERQKIQKEINSMSLEAGKYAIPNELDRILDQIGSSMVNAFTSEEIVAYFNVFPSSQMEKWLTIYSHRFKNPVFRLFQSELETVFEEKNMYMDDFSSTLIENFYENFYKVHPYGTQTVLGTIEHIKNPSLTNMRKMYDTYYVANNMALVLTGNFNSKEIIPIIEDKFGSWKSGEIPKYPKYPEKDFEGIEKIVKRLTPVKVGLIGYRTVPANHKDEIALEVCTALLSNSSSTGYLDKLSIDGKLLEAMCFSDIRNDHGALVVLYVPKIIGQSHKNAFNIVHNEIMKLHTDKIDPNLLEAVKLNLIKEHEQSLENPMDRAFLIASLFTSNKKWEDILNYKKEIRSITEKDIKSVSEHYLNDNLLSFQSKMGFPKKDKLEKPGFDPIIPVNSESESKFATKLDKIPEKKLKPEFIDFNKDIQTHNIKDNTVLYYTKNKINNIFNLSIKFHIGTNSDPRLIQLAEYIQLIGTKDMNLKEFNNQLQKIGCSFWITAEENYFTINIDGFDNYFNESVELLANLLKRPQADDKKLKNLSRNASFLRRFENNNPDDLAKALFEYGIYGENSEYLRRMTVKEVKSLNSETLLDILSTVLSNNFSIHYSGTLKIEEVSNITSHYLSFQTKIKESEFPYFYDRTAYNKNTILFLNDPKTVQSKIYFYIEGKTNPPRERAIAKAYNQYFGTGMSAIVFQEIREFRSMAYTAYAIYRPAFLISKPGYLQAFIGTQCDKTVDAISLMDSLIYNMPIKENRIQNVSSALIQSVNSTKPNWRKLSTNIENWKLQGYKEDPRIMQFKTYNELSFKDIIKFYTENIQSKPMLITIVGNKNNIDMEALAKYGNIIEVNKKIIMN